jgi:ATP-binding protein involved in chromosome partitioning
MAAALPVAITRKDDGLLLEWDRAGDRVWYPARELRLACPCAQCVEEMSGRRLLDPASVPLDIRPVHLALVGSYGLRVQWSDGHGTGIFTFTWLRTQGVPAAATP